MSVWEWLDRLRRYEDPAGNSVERWIAAIALFLGVAVLLLIVKGVLIRRIGSLADRMSGRWPRMMRGMLERTKTALLILLAFYCGSLLLTVPHELASLLHSLAVIVVLLQAAIWGDSLLKSSVAYHSHERLATDAASATTFSLLGFLARLALWALVVLMTLDNLGVNVTALLAGLGIGGIAVALAAQNILGDLFASLSIVLDRPFVLGDSIATGDFSGTVEHIGVKTTRLRSASGEQLVFANSDLLQSRIRNFQRMRERRMLFTLNVRFQTPRDKLAQIPRILREVIESQNPVRFDRAHFKLFGDSALIFEAVYFVLTADFNESMNIQQAINLAICERFERSQIEFAFPTRTVIVEGQPTPRGADAVAAAGREIEE